MFQRPAKYDYRKKEKCIPIGMGIYVNQWAFAKHCLDFVVNEYLPFKLKNSLKFLS